MNIAVRAGVNIVGGMIVTFPGHRTGKLYFADIDKMSGQPRWVIGSSPESDGGLLFTKLDGSFIWTHEEIVRLVANGLG